MPAAAAESSGGEGSARRSEQRQEESAAVLPPALPLNLKIDSPARSNTMAAVTLDQILRGGRELGASDIHLIRGVAPAFRVHGEIRLARLEPLTEELLRGLLDELLNERQRQILEEHWQLCFSRTWPGIGRFRASIYFHGGCREMAIRGSETKYPAREQLPLPS